MPNKIRQIKLKKFRGATDETSIEFEAQKRLVVIFGENGTGKTTILDAIDFSCNKNNVVSLGNKSVGNQKYKFLPSFNCSLGDLEVSVETADNKCSAKFIGKGDISVGAGLPKVEVLRRDAILQIVNGAPKDRLEAIRNMVSYPKIKEIEDALRTACKYIKKIYDDAIKAQEQEETNLKEVWQTAGDKTKDFILWAKERAGIKKDTLEKEKTFWGELTEQAKNLKENDAALTVLLSQSKTIQHKLDEKKNELSLAEQKEKGKTELVNLLVEAKKYIENQGQLSDCPICSNKVNKDNLLAELSKRITAMEELKKIQEEIMVVQKEEEFNANKLLEQKKQIDAIISSLKNLLKENKIKSKIIAASWSAWEKLKDDQFKKNILDVEQEWVKEFTQKLTEYNQLDLIQRSYQAYINKKEESVKSEAKSKKMQVLLETLEKIRKEKVDEVLVKISSTVERMYSIIHPGEGIGSVKFYLDPKKAESLEFDGQFYGESVPPQAYYSESHLDTLGICVFLALSQYNRDDGIVLLDDVLTSVDTQHLGRFIEMLENESKHFEQIFITTHLRLWRDRYKLPIQQSNDVQLLELLPWSSEGGIKHTRTKFYVDELRDLLKEKQFDRQKAASKSGILLEHLLYEIALKYSCKVPLKHIQKYMLAELFDAIDSKIRSLLKVVKAPAAEIMLKAYLDKLQNSAFIRNEVGGHLSDTGTLLSDQDVKDFTQMVIDFAEFLLCDSCGAFPNKSKSGQYWECGCAKLRLYPFQRP